MDPGLYGMEISVDNVICQARPSPDYYLTMIYPMIPYQVSARAECVTVNLLMETEGDEIRPADPSSDSQMRNLIAPACLLVEQPTLH